LRDWVGQAMTVELQAAHVEEQVMEKTP